MDASHLILAFQTLRGILEVDGTFYAAQSLHLSSKDFVDTPMINQEERILHLDYLDKAQFIIKDMWTSILLVVWDIYPKCKMLE